MWQLSFLTGIAVVFGLGNIRKNNEAGFDSFTTLEAVIYRCFSKTGWSLALSWVVFSCHNGYGGTKKLKDYPVSCNSSTFYLGIINSFLSWEAFVPLSKLTYGAYLNHWTMLQIVLLSFTSPIFLTDLLVVI